MLEDCRCCMHRYLFTITSYPPDSTPGSATLVTATTPAVTVSTVAVSSRCPAAGPIPPWQRRARNNLTTLLHYDQFSVSGSSRPSVVSFFFLPGFFQRTSPLPFFLGMAPTYGGSASRQQRLAMARPNEGQDEFGRVQRGGQSSPTLGGLSLREAFGLGCTKRLQRLNRVARMAV